MAPIRPQDHAFVFEAAVLVELRSRLGLNQAGLAELLDVPVNTLSRWERGSNVPDANALAALFSVAVERGITPEFFKERKGAITNRYDRNILVIQWDFQNMGLSPDDIDNLTSEIREYAQLVFPRVGDFKATAYVSGVNWNVRNALMEVGFGIESSYYNADRQLIQDGEVMFGLHSSSRRPSADPLRKRVSEIVSAVHSSSSLPTADPSQSVYMLISNDGGYADYLTSLKNAGIEVFVCGTAACSERLTKTVSHDHFLPLQRAYMVAMCYEVACRLAGKSISKSAFGNQCRVALEEDGFEGDEYEELLEDTGFSLHRPFASALQHMSTMGILRVKQSDDDPSRVTLTIPKN